MSLLLVKFVPVFPTQCFVGKFALKRENFDLRKSSFFNFIDINKISFPFLVMTLSFAGVKKYPCIRCSLTTLVLSEKNFRVNLTHAQRLEAKIIKVRRNKYANFLIIFLANIKSPTQILFEWIIVFYVYESDRNVIRFQ